MLSIHKLPDVSSIRDLKSAYLEHLVAPLDGMWDQITDESEHREIQIDGKRAGYFIANEDGILLQFYLIPDFENHARAVFDEIVSQDLVSEALVSTADPLLLMLCRDKVKNAPVHTYLYEYRGGATVRIPTNDAVAFGTVEAHELEHTVAFQQESVGGAHDLSEWLRSYSGNLISRGELHRLSDGDEWIGLGEFRRSDSQPGVVDLGVMVAPAHRKRGWATDILTRLLAMSADEGLRAICSTTAGNVAAQKAIAKAGFASRHRLVEVTL